MKRFNADQGRDLLIIVVSLLFIALFMCIRKYAISVNPKDIEFLGTLSLGIFIFYVAAIVFIIKVVRSIKYPNN